MVITLNTGTLLGSLIQNSTQAIEGNIWNNGDSGRIQGLNNRTDGTYSASYISWYPVLDQHTHQRQPIIRGRSHQDIDRHIHSSVLVFSSLLISVRSSLSHLGHRPLSFIQIPSSSFQAMIGTIGSVLSIRAGNIKLKKNGNMQFQPRRPKRTRPYPIFCPGVKECVRR